MPTEHRLSESLEDYLEAIYHIEEAKRAARAKDIAQRLKVHGASVTQALRALKERRLVNYEPYDLITLTKEGHRAAADVVRRHRTLRDFLIKVLLLDEKTADENACRLEHNVDSMLMERLVEYLSFLDHCPLGSVQLRDDGTYRCAHGEMDGDCGQCRLVAGMKDA